MCADRRQTPISLISAERFIRERSITYADSLIVDARHGHEYVRGHIAGAVHMPWERFSGRAPKHAGPALAEPGYWGVLADPDGDLLASHGVADGRPMIVYAGGAGSRGREGRIAWMLLHSGVQQVALLDGGWDAWLALGGKVETDQKVPLPGRFTVRRDETRRRTLSSLRQRRSGFTLVDTRTAEEFAGAIQEYLPRRGHIPGAVSLPYTRLFHQSGRYVDRDTYRREIVTALPVGTELVAYCEVGVRAALFAVLHEAHTGQVVPVYDGSWMEWSLERDLPVELGGRG